VSREFDAIIIGAGQAGGPLAHQLADRGWEVALVEREHLGGSCINYGCTPTKKMLASAKVAQMARRAAEFGVDVGDVQVNLAKVVSLKDELVQQWRDGQQYHADSRPSLTLIRGEASFSGPHTIVVNGEQLTAGQLFINTGTSASVPPVEGIESVPYLTNKTILDLSTLPDHLLVIGGSYIGLEFGQMFRRFGSRVTVVEYHEQITPREDRDVAFSLLAALEAEGMRFRLKTQAVCVAQAEDGGIRLLVRDRASGDEHELAGSHLLVATGRRPNTAALNLEGVGINHHNGWINTDEYLETNVPGVYALGDVKGGPAFTHISYNDFQIALHNLFHPKKQSIAGRLVPYALFTDPELGRVGLTEKEAREQGIPYKVGQIPMSHVARAIERNETAGMMKVIVHAGTDEILGAAILGTDGGELVQTLMALMMAGASWRLFHKAVFIHPTLTEGFFSLMDSLPHDTPEPHPFGQQQQPPSPRSS
jgi:pyruvate/2-oxoglutarate dehydrogenase complex dihydrolipoamide dehydrogenase (E3) component